MRIAFTIINGLVGLLILSTQNLKAQTPDWSTTVANIIYNNCSSCHHPAGIGPFSLMSYQETVDNAFAVQDAVINKRMPPWPADPLYRHFANEAYLEQTEIDAINNWINGGMPIGNTSLAPDPPTFSPGGSFLDTIDYVVQIEPYTLQSNNEEYRWYVVQTNFTDTVYVNQIEVIPGLSLIHHADISYDITGESYQNDLQDPLPGFNSSTGSPTYSFYMNAWQPGGNIVRYPADWGIAVPPGADFVLEIHYGPDGAGLVDSTKMNLRFVTNSTDVRPVRVQWILYDTAPSLIDGPLVIPANTIKTFHQVSAPLTNDKSFISICPHMHSLGKSYRVWYKTPSGDSVPLIDIPDWHTHWQKYYTFQYIEKIPAGSILYSEGVYDNTTANENNPNDPPQTVYKGAYSTDEMFLCYVIFTDYQAGDENILMDSSLLNSIATENVTSQNEWKLFPNPVDDYTNIISQTSDNATLQLINVLGEVLQTKKITGNKNNLDLSKLSSGIYFINIISESQKQTLKLVVR